MTHERESWPRRAEPHRVIVTRRLRRDLRRARGQVLHAGFYKRSQIIDTPIYQRYGDAMANGRVPYRDFQLEYPPAALPAFVIPSLLRSNDGDLRGYRSGFEAEMLVCGALALLFMLSILLSLEAGSVRIGAALGFAALAPLLLGSVVLSRFDLWPAALVTGALAAFVAGRQRLGAGVLGLAVAAKIFPAVLVPLAAVCDLEAERPARGVALLRDLRGGGWLACFLPFFVLSPHGVWHSVDHADEPAAADRDARRRLS